MIAIFIYIVGLSLALLYGLWTMFLNHIWCLKQQFLVVASPHCLKVSTISFFFLSIFVFDVPWKFEKSSSQYKPMSFFSITVPSRFLNKRTYKFTNVRPIITSHGNIKVLVTVFFHPWFWVLEMKYLRWMYYEYSSVISINDFA